MGESASTINARARRDEAANRRKELENQHAARMKLLENANKQNKREAIQDTIKDLENALKMITSRQDQAKKDKTSETQKQAEAKGEKERLMGEINKFETYKKEQIDAFIIDEKINIAEENYFRDRDEVKNAITKTGVHSDDVGKFLMLTHALTGATMSTQAEAERLNAALNLFGTIINNECQDKLTIDYYFNEQNLKEFIPILYKQGFETLDHMICDDEKQCDKEILAKLDKGIDKQEKLQRAAATEKKKENEQMIQKLEEQLSEIEKQLSELDSKAETKDNKAEAEKAMEQKEKETEASQLTAEQSRISSDLNKYKNALKVQNDILDTLDEKAKAREEEKAEPESKGDDEEVHKKKWLNTKLEEEELCQFLLKAWKLEEFWETLEDEGWDDADDWATITAEQLEKDIGIKKAGKRNKFIKNSKLWKAKQDGIEQKEEEKRQAKASGPVYYYLTTIQQRNLKNICLRSNETWAGYQKEKSKITKKQLLQLSPVLGEFFGRINTGVKQCVALINYKNDLSDAQRQAIQMRNENNKRLKAIEFRKKDAENRRSLVKSSDCAVYSDSSSQWCKGKVIDVKKDKDGEWLTVEYYVDDERRTKDVQRYNKNIKVEIKEEVDENKEEDDTKTNDDLAVQKTDPIVVQTQALLTAAIVSINVSDSLTKEFTVSAVTERGLTLALSVEDCCMNIINNQGEMRQSVFLAQEILKFKPANMNDEKTRQLWDAVDKGIVRIFSSAIEMVKVAATYFSYFLRFQNSFKFFVSCYDDDPETSLFISLERIKKDIREFNQFRETFSNTVAELNKTAMECISNCVKQQIGHSNWEKTRKSLKTTEEAYLIAMKKLAGKESKLKAELDKLEKDKVVQIAEEARAKEQITILEKDIKDYDTYYSKYQTQLNNMRSRLSSV